MNTATMRRVDRWLGRPLAGLLTVWRRVTERSDRRAASPPAKILVLKLAEHGVWVVAYSALMDAVEMVGAEHVYVMTFSDNRFVLDQLGILPPENIIEVPTPGTFGTLSNLVRAVRRVRAEQIDSVVDFEFFARSSAVIAYLTGAPRRVGFHPVAEEAGYRGDLMTHRLSFNPRLHAGQTFRMLVGALREDPAVLPALGSPVAPATAPPHRSVTTAQREAVTLVVQDALGTEELPRLVLLNANAGDLIPHRRWPDDRYVELARRLLEDRDDVAVLLTGAPAEAAAAERLAAQVGSPRCVSVAGRTTLGELIVLYGLADVLVTNDSGPAHYAALAPVDIVTLFGPESPHVFGSLSPRGHTVWAELACSPCVNAYNDRVTACRNNLCMQAITVDEVAGTVHRLLDGPATPVELQPSADAPPGS
jgi:ADP-heptose:LPS heptosyltransferase